MKTYTLPVTPWDGNKFAARYGLALNPMNPDFLINGDGLLVVFPDQKITDNPPIFDPPDTPVVVDRNSAIALADSGVPESKLLRGGVNTLLDELNLHAAKINSMIDAVNAATSLADLKARFALIADYPTRTMSQAITSIKNHIQNGDVD
jgi:hypothetical protein